MHPSAGNYQQDNRQQMDAYELIYCRQGTVLFGIVRGINVFLEFLYTIQSYYLPVQ